MKKTLSLILLVLAFMTSSGQKNYIPGYVVRLNGDTVHSMKGEMAFPGILI